MFRVFKKFNSESKQTETHGYLSEQSGKSPKNCSEDSIKSFKSYKFLQHKCTNLNVSKILLPVDDVAF